MSITFPNWNPRGDPGVQSMLLDIRTRNAHARHVSAGRLLESGVIYLTTKDLAAKARVSAQAVVSNINRGHLKSIRIPCSSTGVSRHLIHPKDAERWLKYREENPEGAKRGPKKKEKKC